MSESMAQRVVLTLADKEKLEAELNMLKTVKKAEVTRDIAEARAHGDLSENAEYDEAKNEEARVQGRIMQLEEMLANATIVDEGDATADTVSLGTVVTVYGKTTAYKSILTGYTRSGRATTLLLGNVRIDLTKKLILERRRSK